MKPLYTRQQLAAEVVKPPSKNNSDGRISVANQQLGKW